jgi:hypothetical protein
VFFGAELHRSCLLREGKHAASCDRNQRRPAYVQENNILVAGVAYAATPIVELLPLNFGPGVDPQLAMVATGKGI